jgi:hypothetical protein
VHYCITDAYFLFAGNYIRWNFVIRMDLWRTNE